LTKLLQANVNLLSLGAVISIIPPPQSTLMPLSDKGLGIVIVILKEEFVLSTRYIRGTDSIVALITLPSTTVKRRKLNCSIGLEDSLKKLQVNRFPFLMVHL